MADDVGSGSGGGGSSRGADAGAGGGLGVDEGRVGPFDGEGARMSKFRECLRMALSKSQADLRRKGKAVRKCFKSTSGVDGEVAMAHARVAMRSVCKGVQAEFNKVCAEHNMVAQLNRLDTLMQPTELIRGETALPRPGAVDPIHTIRQHMMAAKLAEEKRLTALLSSLEEDNQALRAKVADYKARVGAAQAEVEARTDALNKAADKARALTGDE